MLIEDFMIKSKYEINTKILESNKKYLDEVLLKKEEIEDEIGDYSLTPKKNIVRQFFPFKAEAKPIEEITSPETKPEAAISAAVINQTLLSHLSIA
jgi:hypothetical protein